MITPIQHQLPLQPKAGSAAGPEETQTSGKVDFGEMLQRSINEVGRLQNTADMAVRDLATGQTADIHNTMIAVEKAGTAFELILQVRNKLVSAYETVMRMQV
jgi:flagellar hook-basal body complex protein FliE